MIRTKRDLSKYILADSLANGVLLDSLKSRIFHTYFDQTWIFHILLRRVEYYKNKKRTALETLYYQYLRYRYKKVSIRLGFSIPPNTCGPGLSLPHYGSIVINGAARIGENCMVHSCVNIGATGGSYNAPQIGDNVFIGPGAKIYGDIVIADNVYIGANAVVNKSIHQKNAVVVGIPGKIIKVENALWWEKNRLILSSINE